MELKNSYLNNYSEQVLLKAKMTADSSGCGREDKIIRIKKEPRTAGGTAVSAKVLDEFNYVSHAKLSVGADGSVESVSCDCTSGRIGELCEHTAALIIRLSGSDVPAPPERGTDERPVPPAGNDFLPFDLSAETDSSGFRPHGDYSGYSERNDGIDLDGNFADALDRQDIFSGPDVPAAEDYDGSAGGENLPDSFCGMKILLGKDPETDEDVYWYPNDTEKLFHINTGIIGTMGTGKTQFTKSLVAQLYRERRNNFAGEPLGVLIFDYKGDYNEDKPEFVNAVNARVIRPYKMPYNPLALNLRRSNVPRLPLHTANAFADTVGQIYDLGGKQRGALLDCIKAAYDVCGIDLDDSTTWTRPAPTFDVVYRIFRRDFGDKDMGLLGVAMTKLSDLVVFEPDRQKAQPLMKLLNGVVVFDISGYDSDIQNLVAALTIDHFYSQMQALGSSKTDGRFRAVRKLILVDEADNFMRGKYPSLSKIMKEGREFGVGVILSTQSLEHFSGASDDYSKYILTWAVHNTNDMSRRNIEYVFKLDQKERAADETYAGIKKLQKHFSIVKISNDPPRMIRDRSFWELMGK